MISQSAEYALRAVVCLAGHCDKALTTQEIARSTHVPPGYLAKILQSLVRSHIVLSQRGLGGGFALAKGPQDLTLFEVVQAVDASRRILTCPLGIGSHGTNLCPLHRRIDNAIVSVERMLSATTVAQVMAEPSACDALCEHSPACACSPAMPAAVVHGELL